MVRSKTHREQILSHPTQLYRLYRIPHSRGIKLPEKILLYSENIVARKYIDRKMVVEKYISLKWSPTTGNIAYFRTEFEFFFFFFNTLIFA